MTTDREHQVYLQERLDNVFAVYRPQDGNQISRYDRYTALCKLVAMLASTDAEHIYDDTVDQFRAAAFDVSQSKQRRALRKDLQELIDELEHLKDQIDKNNN